MFFIKQIYFNRSIYPIFYDNLFEAQKHEQAVIFVDIIQEKLVIMVIINLKAVIFEKLSDSPMVIKKMEFYEKISSPSEDIYKIILSTKNNAITVNNHGFIEKLSEEVNKIKIFYRLSVEQQKQIWHEVLILDSKFFNSNRDMLITPINTVDNQNKWID